MKLKYYIALVLIVMVAISLALYKFGADFTFSLPSYNNSTVQLPLIVWLGIIFGLFMGLSIIFFIIDWIRFKINNYAIKTDIDTLSAQIISQTIKDEMDVNFMEPKFKNSEFRLISRIISRFKLTPKFPSDEAGVAKIDDVLENIKQITLGYEQNIRKYQFDPHNEFAIQNMINGIKRNYKNGFNVITDSNFDNEVYKRAYLQMLEKANLKDMLRMLEVSIFLDKEMFFQTCDAIIKEQVKSHQRLQDAVITKSARRAKMEPMDYVDLARHLKENLDPDDWLKLFENMAVINEKVELAFLYVLCDLEMLEVTQKRLTALPKDEYLKIRAYVDLRKSGAHYPLELFFRI